MKTTILFFLFAFALFTSEHLFAQNNEKAKIDSLLNAIAGSKEDTNKIKLYVDLFYVYNKFNCEDALKHEKPALQLAEKLNEAEGIAKIKNSIGRLYWRLGKFETALKYHNEALQIYQDADNSLRIALTLTFIAQDYADGGNYPEAKKFLFEALKIYEDTGDKIRTGNIYNLLS